MHSHHTVAPEHRRVKGNEVADAYAKWVTDGYSDAMDKSFLREASPAYLIRRETEDMEYEGLDPPTRQD